MKQMAEEKEYDLKGLIKSLKNANDIASLLDLEIQQSNQHSKLEIDRLQSNKQALQERIKEKDGIIKELKEVIQLLKKKQ